MTTRKRNPDAIAGSAWQSFATTPEGKTAIALLFREYGFFDVPLANDHGTMARSVGQRDVLVRISQLINWKPEQAPALDRDTSDILDRILRSN